MSRQPILLGVILLVFVYLPASAQAQNSSGDEDPSLLDSAVNRLDNLGHAIFGGIVPKKKAQQEEVDPSFYENGGYVTGQSRSGSTSGRAGIAVQGGAASQGYPSGSYSSGTGRGVYVRRSTQTPAQAPVSGPGGAATSELGAASSGASGSDLGGPRPLYQRLMSARQSAFPSAAPSPSTESRNAVSSPTVQAGPNVIERAMQQGDVGDKIFDASATPDLEPPSDDVASGITIKQPTGIRRSAGETRMIGRPSGSAPKPSTDRLAEPKLAPAADARPTVASPSADRVLMTQRSPALSVRALGPRQIAVGKESAFEVFVSNTGEVAAEGVVVSIELPEWAEVQGAEASAGAASPAAPAKGVRVVQWNVGPVQAKDQEKLVMRIVPRASRPIDLAMRVAHTPLASQAVIEVQEPKLVLRLQGPRDVLYGKKELFKLELLNTGNGDAENVVISLAPIGSAGGTPDTHKLGSLPAGKKKIIELELTPRQDGQLTVQVGITADAGVRAELVEKIVVRRPEVQLAVEGPKVKYVGTAATYRIHVNNPGTAPAQNLQLSITLPRGAKYLASDKSGQLAKDGSKVNWTLMSLAPGAKEVVTLECQLAEPGAKQLVVTSSADNDLTASTMTTTQVDAIADLALSVSDPVGPVGVGEDAWYELRVQNRGTQSAAGVEVVTYFSNGVEPVAAEGGPSRIEPGQVAFDPIVSLPPGKTVTLKIKARGQAAGNHVFRAEVFCKPLGSHLVSEETTLFYGSASDTTRLVDQSPKKPAPADSRELLRTAERPQPLAPASRYGTPTLAPVRR